MVNTILRFTKNTFDLKNQPQNESQIFRVVAKKSIKELRRIREEGKTILQSQTNIRIYSTSRRRNQSHKFLS